MESGFTQEELDKVILTPEAIEHLSKPDELKRLILERELYKKVAVKQNEALNDIARAIDYILDTPVYSTSKTYTNPFGFKQTRLITKSARDLAYEYQLNNFSKWYISNCDFKCNYKIVYDDTIKI